MSIWEQFHGVPNVLQESNSIVVLYNSLRQSQVVDGCIWDAIHSVLLYTIQWLPFTGIIMWFLSEWALVDSITKTAGGPDPKDDDQWIENRSLLIELSSNNIIISHDKPKGTSNIISKCHLHQPRRIQQISPHHVSQFYLRYYHLSYELKLLRWLQYQRLVCHLLTLAVIKGVTEEIRWQGWYRRRILLWWPRVVQKVIGSVRSTHWSRPNLSELFSTFFGAYEPNLFKQHLMK